MSIKRQRKDLYFGKSFARNLRVFNDALIPKSTGCYVGWKSVLKFDETMVTLSVFPTIQLALINNGAPDDRFCSLKDVWS